MNCKQIHNLILLTILVVFKLPAQIQAPATPQFSNSFQSPVYFNSSIQNSQSTNYSIKPVAINGNTAEGIIAQQNQLHGVQYPVVPPSNPYLLHQFVLNEYNQKQSTDNKILYEKQKHVLEILNELNEDENKRNKIEPVSNLEITSSYQTAYSKINDMLTGKTKLSFIDATYYSEAAYGDVYMDFNQYKLTITQSADYIKKWMQQNKIPINQYNTHYAIQQFMGDTTSLTVKLPDDKQNSKTIIHYPYKYDYEDYDGKVDYRNYFSTKCLATGTGQCNSMPIVYLQLCEALGVKGYLAFAPFHSYIKFKDQSGKILNYEPTSHWVISDKWYQEHLGVTQKAKMKGIYLDTLNKKQTVANSLVDLAISYMMKTPKPDTAFIIKCLSTAEKYFPKKNNVTLYLAKSSLLSRQLDEALRKHKVKDLSEVKNFTDTNNLYNRLLKNEIFLNELGYQELPQAMYEELIQHQKNGIKSPEAKTKKSLFIQTN